MHCIFCYKSPITIINPRTQARKGLIFYYPKKENLKKHVDVNHIVITKRFEKVNNLLKET